MHGHASYILDVENCSGNDDHYLSLHKSVVTITMFLVVVIGRFFSPTAIQRKGNGPEVDVVKFKGTQSRNTYTSHQL